MKKSVITIAVATTVGLGTMLGGPVAKTKAASIFELKGQQNKLQDQRSGVKSDIHKVNEKIGQLQKQQSGVKDDIKRIELVIGETSEKIKEKNAKIKETNAEINKLQADIKIIQERMQKRSDLLKERARNYQENGVVNYLDVLLGAHSFSDFIDRTTAVATLLNADQEILRQHEADKKELETKQAKVKKELAGLQEMMADLKKMNQQLAAQKAEKDKMLKTLAKEEAKEEKHVMGLKEQEQILASQEIAIKKAIQQEKERQAAEAAAATKATVKKAAKKVYSNTTRNSHSRSESSSSANMAISSGAFTRPTVGPVTSGYGFRSYDHSFHNGIDFGSQTGSDPIVAAADGVVSRSYQSASYGECIFISSIVNGQLYTTVYAHMASGSRLVQEGQTVKKGQRIGTKGATGAADGVHLHFELHKGQWNYSKSNRINPAGIIPGI